MKRNVHTQLFAALNTHVVTSQSNKLHQGKLVYNMSRFLHLLPLLVVGCMVLQTAVGGEQNDEYDEVQESKLEATTPQEYFANFAAKKLTDKKKKPINKVKKKPYKQTPVSKNYVNTCAASALDKFDYTDCMLIGTISCNFSLVLILT